MLRLLKNFRSAPYESIADRQELTQAAIGEVIQLAWEDDVSFEAINAATGLSETQVIKLMRSNMKRSSFRMWRKRVSGRRSKHERLN